MYLTDMMTDGCLRVFAGRTYPGSDVVVIKWYVSLSVFLCPILCGGIGYCEKARVPLSKNYNNNNLIALMTYVKIIIGLFNQYSSVFCEMGMEHRCNAKTVEQELSALYDRLKNVAVLINLDPS